MTSGVHRLAEGVGVEAFVAASESDPVDRPDETGQVVVGIRLGVVLVGLEPVGALRGSRDEVRRPPSSRSGPVRVGGGGESQPMSRQPVL